MTKAHCRQNMALYVQPPFRVQLGGTGVLGWGLGWGKGFKVTKLIVDKHMALYGF